MFTYKSIIISKYEHTFVTINKSDRLSLPASNHFFKTLPITHSFSYTVAVSICLYPAVKAASRATSNSFPLTFHCYKINRLFC